MSESLKPVAGIDHGTPPPGVLQQQERIEKILKEEELANLGNSLRDLPTLETPVPSMAFPILRARSEPLRPTERISLQFIPETAGVPAFKFEFDVVEVCVKEYYISLLIASDLGFEPSGPMQFRLSYKDKVYPVIYSGAEFEFKTVNVRGINFLRDKRLEESLNSNSQHD